MPHIWMWPDADLRYLPKIKEYIANESKVESQCIKVVSFSPSPGMESVVPVCKFLLEIARTVDLLQNYYTTFLNVKDTMLALQLCLARINQEVEGEFTAPSRQVLRCYSHYSSTLTSTSSFVDDPSDDDTLISKVLGAYQKFIQQSNCVDQWLLCSLIGKHPSLILDDVASCILFLGVEERDFMVEVFHVLSPERHEVHHVSIELPLDEVLAEEETNQDFTITSSSSDVSAISVEPSPFVNHSATEIYVKELFLSFIQLLVNSRSELALAKVFGSPILELSHQAFTHLKQEASKVGISMYQMATSYVIKKRLGGKGYMPKENCPLNPHSEALSAFCDLFDHLHCIKEEEPDPCFGATRIIRVIHSKLVRSSSSLKRDSIEKISNYLQDLIGSMKSMPFSDEDKQKSKTCFGHLTFLLLREVADHLSCQIPCPAGIVNYLTTLRSGRSHLGPLSQTPLTFPTVFSLFRSPILVTADVPVTPSAPTPMKVRETSHKNVKSLVSPLCKTTPKTSKTTHTPGKENISPTKVQPQTTPSSKPALQADKRTFPEDNKPRAKKKPRKLDLGIASKKPKPRKPFAQVQGQMAITSFFKKS